MINCSFLNFAFIFSKTAFATSSKFTVPVFFKTSLVFLLPFEIKKEKTDKRLTSSITEK